MTKYKTMDAQFFAKNRSAFTKKMKANSMAIFFSNDLMPRSADGHYPFRQNPDFFYLSGIDQEECILILYPDAPLDSQKAMLFLKETNERIAVWEGDKVNKEQGQALSGISSVFWNDEFTNTLSHLANGVECFYLNMNENDRASSEVIGKEISFAREMRNKYPLHHFERSAPILSALRSIKSAEEIATIQSACDITEKAFRQVLKTIRPGMMEYEVEAEIISTFIRNGATGHAYEPIVASGANACVLHYVNNSALCKDGDLILLDFGAEYGNYASDLTRTIPVNGKFSARQKEVYQACLNVHHEAKKIIRPGITLSEFNQEVKLIMTSALVDIKLIDKNLNKEDKLRLCNKYFPHGTSHFMGLDVHDVGARYGKIQENMCFTIEPGIYIREEGIGVRIENDIIVRENGNLDLMSKIPIEIEEIEELMLASK
ncbi:MAG: aminopeptidase P family protein [Chitinophagales bacterium]|nr:aminopeptidase P family protein [Chitinophagales bacterium]